MPCRWKNTLRESGSTPTGGRKISRSIILSAPPMPAFRMPVAACPSPDGLFVKCQISV